MKGLTDSGERELCPMNKFRVTATVIGGGARGVLLRKAVEEDRAADRASAGPESLGRVHSCFERVVNIVVPEAFGRGTDVLIGICRPGVPLSPLHLRLDWRSAMLDLPVREGEPVLVTRRELAFPSLTIAWGEAEEYSTFFQRQEHASLEAGPVSEPLAPAVRELCARAVAEGLAAGQHFCEGLLPLFEVFDFDPENRRAPDEGAGGEGGLSDTDGATVADRALSHTAVRAIPVLCRLSAAVRERRQDRVFSAARNMLGLGPGLTPSGDDFLTGLMVTDLAWRRRFPSRPTLGAPEMWSRLAGEAFGLTGAISCQQLRLAAGGSSNEVFERVCWRLSGADERVLSDMPDLARFGATSGLDYLAGVVFALRHLLAVAA